MSRRSRMRILNETHHDSDTGGSGDTASHHRHIAHGRRLLLTSRNARPGVDTMSCLPSSCPPWLMPGPDNRS